MGGARRAPQSPHAPRPGEAVPLRDCSYSDGCYRVTEGR